MAYRMRYIVNVDWIGPGMAPGYNYQGNPLAMSSNNGNAQTLQFQETGAGGTSSTFVAGDITTLLAAMSTDLSTQMNAQIARVQAFATGGQ